MTTHRTPVDVIERTARILRDARRKAHDELVRAARIGAPDNGAGAFVSLTLDEMAAQFAALFEHTNPRFDRARFFEDAGVPGEHD